MTTTLPVEYPVPNHAPAYAGKVREIYDLGDDLIIVATDRVSTYDVVMPDRIPGKGSILTHLSGYWFRGFAGVVPTHFVSDRVEDLPADFRAVTDLHGRSMRVKKADRFDVECVVRGYLAGSGWKEYQRSQSVCGVDLPSGLKAFQKLPEPIFTPTTKAEQGHDEPTTYAAMVDEFGEEVSASLRELSLDLYRRASAHAWERGVIIADTKFEFGRIGPDIAVIDEVLTPDSSRFWDREGYEPGREPEPMDKQFVRNAADETGWDHTEPGPRLSAEVLKEAERRYRTAVDRITHGEDAPRWLGGESA